MPKRSSKKPDRDENRSAAQAVRHLTGQDEPQEAPQEAEPTPDGKNPAAVALGRLGGKKGGPARAKKLTPEQRSKIARKAAEKRWRKEAD